MLTWRRRRAARCALRRAPGLSGFCPVGELLEDLPLDDVCIVAREGDEHALERHRVDRRAAELLHDLAAEARDEHASRVVAVPGGPPAEPLRPGLLAEQLLLLVRLVLEVRDRERVESPPATGLPSRQIVLGHEREGVVALHPVDDVEVVEGRDRRVPAETVDRRRFRLSSGSTWSRTSEKLRFEFPSFICFTACCTSPSTISCFFAGAACVAPVGVDEDELERVEPVRVADVDERAESWLGLEVGAVDDRSGDGVLEVTDREDPRGVVVPPAAVRRARVGAGRGADRAAAVIAGGGAENESRAEC